MAFYHFLAVFPILFASLALLTRAPHLRDSLAHAIQDVSNQVLPERLMNLLQTVAEKITREKSSQPPRTRLGGLQTGGAIHCRFALCGLSALSIV